MRSKAIYNLHVWRDVLQEQGDKAKGSRGGITAVQQSCQSTSRGGYTQPCKAAASTHTRDELFMVFFGCQDIIVFYQDPFLFFESRYNL